MHRRTSTFQSEGPSHITIAPADAPTETRLRVRVGLWGAACAVEFDGRPVHGVQSITFATHAAESTRLEIVVVRSRDRDVDQDFITYARRCCIRVDVRDAGGCLTVDNLLSAEDWAVRSPRLLNHRGALVAPLALDRPSWRCAVLTPDCTNLIGIAEVTLTQLAEIGDRSPRTRASRMIAIIEGLVDGWRNGTIQPQPIDPGTAL